MDEALRRAIGGRLKEARLSAGFSQKYVADRMHLKARQTVSAWERGETPPTTEQWYELAPLLGQSLDYLVYNVRTVPVSQYAVMETVFRAPGVQPSSAVFGTPERLPAS